MWTFTPIYKCSIWGGGRLPEYKDDRHPGVSDSPIGESWEVSAVDGSVSVVAGGPDAGLTLTQLIDRYGSALLGESVYQRFGTRFPLLIKLIDAADNLSVQVHPDDEMAHAMGHPYGKNEMWLVLEAKQGATLANGFLNPVDPSDLHELVDSGKIVDVMRYSQVRPGDAFLIPAGRVHALGKGILIAEIQQSSNDTFRLFDYNRTDSAGNHRQLHLDRAAKALNYADTDGFPLDYTMRSEGVSKIAHTSSFSVNLLRYCYDATRDYSALDSFVVLMCIGGKASISDGKTSRLLTKGNSLMLPARTSDITITTEGDNEFRALEIYI